MSTAWEGPHSRSTRTNFPCPLRIPFIRVAENLENYRVGRELRLGTQTTESDLGWAAQGGLLEDTSEDVLRCQNGERGKLGWGEREESVS